MLKSLSFWESWAPSQTLIDPFVGSAAIPIESRPSKAFLSDSNSHLVNFFDQARSHPQEIAEMIGGWGDDQLSYESMRRIPFANPLQEAARFLYLNRTSYMGIYRTNNSGEFNVPYGGGDRLKVNRLKQQLEELSVVSAGWTFSVSDFREALSLARHGDRVFLDPPYGGSGDIPFRRYGQDKFSFEDHADLSSLAVELARVGIEVVVTLPNNSRILALYKEWEVIALRRSGSGVLTEIALGSNTTQWTQKRNGLGWRRPTDLREAFLGTAKLADVLGQR